MNNILEKSMPIDEAARYLGVSKMTLRRWDASGKLKASFLSPGSHRYYLLSDLQKFTRGLYRIAEEWAQAETATEPSAEFYSATNDRFKTRLERMALEIADVPTLTPISALISSAAGEIGNNSFDHNLGNWPDLPGVFFAYDLAKRVIVLADRGVGVLATLRRIEPKLADDEDALRLAFTKIITARAPEHRGNGLKYVREAINLANARLSFRSGNTELTIVKGEMNIKKAAPIRGTLTMINF